jgi:hypothetical protein
VTWPDGIATAIGITTLALLAIHQHQQRSTTRTQLRTEARHGHQDPQDHHREEDDHPQAGGQEDRPGS